MLLRQYKYDVNCFRSAESFLASADVQGCGCLLTDLKMPGMSGADLIDNVRKTYPHLSIIVVSGEANVSLAVKVMESGAITLLEKPYSPNALLQAIEKALDQSHQRSREAAFIEDIRRRLITLSDEEREVMDHLLRGYSNKQVVKELQMSSRTMDRRRKSLLLKMGVSTIPELATLVGRLPPPE